MRGPLSWIRGIRRPEAFHGHGVTGGFFEGWYVKLADAQQDARFAVIPGVFRGTDDGVRTDEAFVQVLDGATGEATYHRFDPEDFWASSERFDVRVGPNRFTTEGVQLHLPGLTGDVAFSTPFTPWPVTWRRPGIMGPYAWAPRMECYHGVVSFGHELSGQLQSPRGVHDFTHGRGYIEKDWGRAFPAGYVWMHSNHIAGHPDASLVASVAVIPWMRSSFRGFIVGLQLPDGLRTWATYNKSSEVDLRIDGSHVTWTLDGPDGRLTLAAERKRGGLLHAPIRTRMHERVEETLDAEIDILLIDRDGSTVLDARATCSGLEVHGDLERLLAVGTR